MLKTPKERSEFDIFMYELFEKVYEDNKDKISPSDVLEWLQGEIENSAQEVCDEMVRSFILKQKLKKD